MQQTFPECPPGLRHFAGLTAGREQAGRVLAGTPEEQVIAAVIRAPNLLQSLCPVTTQPRNYVSPMRHTRTQGAVQMLTGNEKGLSRAHY